MDTLRVTQNVNTNSGLQTSTKFHSPGVTLVSEKLIKHEQTTKTRTLIWKKNEKFTFIAVLNKCFIVTLSLKGVTKSSSNTLYTVGIASTRFGDNFEQLFEPKTLAELKESCINKNIPSNMFLVCKIQTENDEENKDNGSIMTDITIKYTKSVPR